MKIVKKSVLLLLLIPSNASAFSLSSGISNSLIYLALVTYFTSISLWLLFDSLPGKKKKIKIILLLSQVIPLYYVYIYWDMLYPSVSTDLVKKHAIDPLKALYQAIPYDNWTFLKTVKFVST